MTHGPRRLRRIAPAAALFGACGVLLAAAPPAAPATGYANDFRKAEVGPPPEDLFILQGTFAVAEADGNRFLELAGDPIDTMGVLFGPENQTATDVGAKVYATSAGRLFPEFGLGANENGGYRVWVMPGQGAIELRKGDDTKARADYKKWQSGAWTSLRVRLGQAGGKWAVEAKVWPATEAEPADWTIRFDLPEAPRAGRAAIWGATLADTPIRYDDLTVKPVK